MTRRIRNEDVSGMLPTEAFNKGYRLTWWNPAQMQSDPTILYMEWFEVYRWEYVPSMGEVFDKIEELDELAQKNLQGMVIY